MKKEFLVLQNLGLIVTQKCNLKCAHCMRGNCSNFDMQIDTVKSTLNQIDQIENLCICGGEPLLSLKTMENIFTYIVDNKIMVNQFSLVTNGTIWDDELMKLFDYLNEYIYYNDVFSRKVNGFIAISVDKYHISEIERLKLMKIFLENVKRYQQTKYFYKFKDIDRKLFNQGRAIKLDKKDTISLNPMKLIVSQNINESINTYSIGPLVSVTTNGVITECDASFDEQQTRYNYGNVFDDKILDACLKHGKLVRKKK